MQIGTYYNHLDTPEISITGSRDYGETCFIALGPVLLTLLRHVTRISANGIAAFKESRAPIG